MFVTSQKETITTSTMSAKTDVIDLWNSLPVRAFDPWNAEFDGFNPDLCGKVSSAFVPVQKSPTLSDSVVNNIIKPSVSDISQTSGADTAGESGDYAVRATPSTFSYHMQPGSRVPCPIFLEGRYTPIFDYSSNKSSDHSRVVMDTRTEVEDILDCQTQNEVDVKDVAAAEVPQKKKKSKLVRFFRGISRLFSNKKKGSHNL